MLSGEWRDREDVVRMKRVIAPVASGFATMLWLAGCASAPPDDHGPLTPVRDMSQIGVDRGPHGPEHGFSGVSPGFGGSVADGPAVPGGMRGSGTGVGGD